MQLVDPTGAKAPARTAVTGQSMDGSVSLKNLKYAFEYRKTATTSFDISKSYCHVFQQNAGEHFGNWEAFAWDADDNKGYVTNDDYPGNPSFADDPTYSYQGAVLRFSPDETALACLDAESDADKWCALESGTVEYLKITPSETGTGGTFEWVADKNDANPELYAATEGAHVENGIFTFSTIVDRYLFQLDLAAGTYTRSAVPFPFEPGKICFSWSRLHVSFYFVIDS